ncbi:FUSC family protein [Staphylococcus sp. IVB6246]|uniref:FUSC family protein n=1 Tax=unclassified Staphylococcus TaxID=91994 RepID=UPI0021D09DAA|nr:MULTISPECIES: FUSC family protein [unclassified Staphylococcus]UXR69786.1 FUSC family protein [Staphylococcus sp. IVB6246]UXR71822.1 FUSC family protein [Staphylococcus sp. IVB6240]
MKHYLKHVTYVDTNKIDMNRGIRQGLLMLLPLLYGVCTHNMSLALLVSIGTFAHIYVFKGTFTSRMRAVTFATCGLVVAMMLGTFTVSYPILFGIGLLLVAVIPYYVFTTLHIPGPSSTFFIIAYSLSSVMPEDPHAFLYRGALVGCGGLLGMILVYVESKLKGEQPEQAAVQQDYIQIRQLVHHFNDQVTFNDLTKTAVTTLILSSDILSTTRSSLQRKSASYQRFILLHYVAEGIYSELLELNAKGHRPLPPIVLEMMDYLTSSMIEGVSPDEAWRKRIDVPEKFDGLVQLIYKIDEVLHMPDDQVKRQAQVKSPQYLARLRYNLTPESMNFIATMRYSLIVGCAIVIALTFDFERAYWIPLSAHTVLIGGTTIASIERAGGRWIGTLIGIVIAIGLLLFEPNLITVVLVMCICSALTEMLIGANYALAMIAITVQVILLGGLAQGHLTMMIALPRFLDTTVGILIAVIGVLLIGQRLASKRLPEMMGNVVRIESQMFHYLFSDNGYPVERTVHRDSLRLKLQLDNMETMYRHAYGEWSSNRKRTQYYYPAMFLLQQIHFKLLQCLQYPPKDLLNAETMGSYLLVFENIAKHLEYGIVQQEMTTLPDLNHYAQIRRALMQLQEIALYDKGDQRNPHLLEH